MAKTFATRITSHGSGTLGALGGAGKSRSQTPTIPAFGFGNLGSCHAKEQADKIG